MKVFLVQSMAEYYPGPVLAIFLHQEDAFIFKSAQSETCEIIERTVFSGQPPEQGYNP